MSTAEQLETKSIAEMLADELRASISYNERELHERLARELSVREFRQLIWRVREDLRREMAVEFAASKSRDGTFERISDRKKIDRGRQFFHTGTKKQRRALAIVRAADAAQLDDAGRRAKESAENRIEQSIVFTEASARRRRRT